MSAQHPLTAASFSFRPPEPPPVAAALLAEVRERGGRVYRTHQTRVFCLTDSAEVAEWLLGMGARPFAPRGILRRGLAPGAFFRARPDHGGKVEYDLWLQTIPVADGPEALWEAAG